MHKIHFERPIQTTRALVDITSIHRTVLTQAASNGLLGNAAYLSGGSWLFDTSHPDFDRWYQAHWQQPRVKRNMNGKSGI